MKKFIRDILVLCCLLIIVNLIIYLRITHRLLYRDYEAVLGENVEQYNTFIFADSHGWALTKDDPQIGDDLGDLGIKNLSYGSDSYQDMLAKLHWLLEQPGKVDTIILTVDDHMLTKRSSNRNRVITYIKPENYEKIYPSESILRFYYYYLVRYFPMLYPSNQALIKQYLFSSFSDTLNEESVSSWADLAHEWQMEKVNRRMTAFYPNQEYKPQRKLSKAMKNIVELARENNIVIIGMKFPISVPMRTAAVRYKGKVAAYFEEIGGQKVLDYEELLDSPTYFADQDHVNVQGASEIYKKLNIDLRKK